MQVPDLPKLTKSILQIILLCLFMYSSGQNNPSFDGCKVKAGILLLSFFREVKEEIQYSGQISFND
jgi:hypothetical protein